jgi:predicted membrane-bound mannosyltransferase
MYVSNRIEIFLIAVLIITSSFLRFPQLSYSHFYGDETKVIYWNKTTPASQFLLNQRKGPFQFVVAWTVEKLTGSFNERTVRTPFAVAGVLNVYIFYLLVKKILNRKAALFSSFLFSFNGFFVAYKHNIKVFLFFFPC